MTNDANAKKKLALLVDDDVDFLMQMKAMLLSSGFDVITAEGTVQAEEILKDRLPDVAIVDLMMEESDGGFTLCYHIKSIDKSIPVILVTAVASETGMDFSVDTGEERSWVMADALLAKPVRFEQLQKELDKLLKDA